MKRVFLIILMCLVLTTTVYGHETDFPRDEASYEDGEYEHVFDVIKFRLAEEPFNGVATFIFLLAILHTMLTGKIKKEAHHLEERYIIKIKEKKVDPHSKSVAAGLLHLLGEIEVVFGFWTIILGVAIAAFYDWSTFTHYIENLHYTEPIFVVVIMGIASSRPILIFFETLMHAVVKRLGEGIETWWFVILIMGPLLGSLITEPAAMTISAYLLSEKVFAIKPSRKVQYMTLALLFVNVSIGGALTNFAAPPILMVAEPWGWSISYMFFNFGWKAVIAIVISTTLYFLLLRHDFKDMHHHYELYKFKKYIQTKFISQKELESSFDILSSLVSTNTHFFSEMDNYSMILKNRIKDIAKEKLSDSEAEALDIENAIDEKFDSIKMREYKRAIPGLLSKNDRPVYHDPNWDYRDDPVPLWITVTHIVFLVWTIVNAHNAALFLGGFLFFLGFFQVTSYYQNRLDLKPALMVAFFLSGLVIHGTLQSWWISPILGSLPALGLNLTAIGLTAFNDNAALTYLATLVPDFSEGLKYAVVAGAISGGGLTVIANAPNPIGVSILKKHFDKGVSPISIAKYALIPTIIASIIFYLF